MTELVRERYLSQIRPFYHDHGMIKVLVGLRRSGKSVLMSQIERELIAQGIEKQNIVSLDLDDRVYRNITAAESLERCIDDGFRFSDGPHYLLIDEVQNVEGFETLLNGYRNEGVSVFITGSNSYLLSGELTTKLTGRYIEFRILPFSYREVQEYRKLNGIETDDRKDFNEYLIYGGFPKRFEYSDHPTQEKYVDSILEETKEKDILTRSNIRDRHLLDVLVRFISSVPSQEISSPSISNYLRKEGLNTKPATVQKYLDLIFSSNISSKCQRFDVIGKKALKTLYKSYLADMSLHTFESGRKDRLDYGMLVENIVYNELISRGYKLMVGKKGPYEIDFVVFSGLKKAYVQVAFSIADPEVRKREIRPLLGMKDNYPKYLITMDPLVMEEEGIHILNLVDDLLLGEGFKF